MAEFVETPHGLFTADGVWFHTTVAGLRDFAPDVVEHTGVDRLVAEASAWTRFPAHAAVWVLLVSLVIGSPLQAALAALVSHIFLSIWGPLLVRPGGARLVRWSGSPLLQGLAYVTVLSALAPGGRLGAVGAGLAGFILLRWGIVDRLVRPLVRYAPGMTRTLPAPDRTLRNLIIRYAMNMGRNTGEVDEMERRMLEIWNYRKNGGAKRGKKP
jgi:hypothetical protein